MFRNYFADAVKRYGKQLMDLEALKKIIAKTCG